MMDKFARNFWVSVQDGSGVRFVLGGSVQLSYL